MLLMTSLEPFKYMKTAFMFTYSLMVSELNIPLIASCIEYFLDSTSSWMAVFGYF